MTTVEKLLLVLAFVLFGAGAAAGGFVGYAIGQEWQRTDVQAERATRCSAAMLVEMAP